MCLHHKKLSRNNTISVRLSVVIPTYKCSGCIHELHRRLSYVLKDLVDSHEIVFVDDGSPENDWEMIHELCSRDPCVRGIKLSRNFGQHYAIHAGLSKASGDWIILMDGDLQDLPEEIPKMYVKAMEGYDSVLARRDDRTDPWLKRLQSWCFYRVFSYLTDSTLDHRIGNFGIYSSTTIKAVLSMGDSIKFFPTMVQWVGFKKCVIGVNHGLRFQGTTSYSFLGMLRLASGTIITFSDKPLHIFLFVGITISSISFAIATYYLTKYVHGSIAVPGYASLILSIWFIAGIIMAGLGVLGIYVGKTFDQVKNRPEYIIANKINFS